MSASQASASQAKPTNPAEQCIVIQKELLQARMNTTAFQNSVFGPLNKALVCNEVLPEQIAHDALNVCDAIDTFFQAFTVISFEAPITKRGALGRALMQSMQSRVLSPASLALMKLRFENPELLREHLLTHNNQAAFCLGTITQFLESSEKKCLETYELNKVRFEQKRLETGKTFVKKLKFHGKAGESLVGSVIFFDPSKKSGFLSTKDNGNIFYKSDTPLKSGQAVSFTVLQESSGRKRFFASNITLTD